MLRPLSVTFLAMSALCAVAQDQPSASPAINIQPFIATVESKMYTPGSEPRMVERELIAYSSKGQRVSRLERWFHDPNLGPKMQHAEWIDIYDPVAGTQLAVYPDLGMKTTRKADPRAVNLFNGVGKGCLPHAWAIEGQGMMFGSPTVTYRYEREYPDGSRHVERTTRFLELSCLQAASRIEWINGRGELTSVTERQVTNIDRSEPSPDLFVVGDGYLESTVGEIVRADAQMRGRVMSPSDFAAAARGDQNSVRGR